MMTARRRQPPDLQTDLFRRRLPTTPVSTAARAVLLPLVEELLSEIASSQIVQGRAEDGHDEDHA
jgi:hypothetical protein